jgi:hypothetical protein
MAARLPSGETVFHTLAGAAIWPWPMGPTDAIELVKTRALVRGGWFAEFIELIAGDSAGIGAGFAHGDEDAEEGAGAAEFGFDADTVVRVVERSFEEVGAMGIGDAAGRPRLLLLPDPDAFAGLGLPVLLRNFLLCETRVRQPEERDWTGWDLRCRCGPFEVDHRLSRLVVPLSLDLPWSLASPEPGPQSLGLPSLNRQSLHLLHLRYFFSPRARETSHLIPR